MLGFLKKIFGDKYDRDIKAVMPLVQKTNAEWEKLQNISHDELRNRTLAFRTRIKAHIADIEHDMNAAAQDALETEDIMQKQKFYEEIDALKKQLHKSVQDVLLEILPEAFAVVKETARRFKDNPELVVTATDFDRELADKKKDFVRIEGDKAIWKNSWSAAGNTVNWDMMHYDVQIIGGIVLHQGKIAEMGTGEGKTLVSTLPAYLNGLTGMGVHIVTVNNYLARRDCEWMGPLHQFLFLTCDCIDLYDPHSPGRMQAYRSDIVYGTNNEFGFDYLRDNMVRTPEEVVQKDFYYAMVDEVDSVLIDDARTPLIISGPVGRDETVQQFIALKPRVERLIEAQKKVAQKYFLDAKALIEQGKTGYKEGEGGLALLRTYRALPKTRALIKFLSEPGMATILRNAENYYMQDQNRRMPEVDAPLYFVIEEKHRNVELKNMGIDLLTLAGEDKDLFVLPDLGGKLAVIEKDKTLSEEAKNEAKELAVNEFTEKSETLHSIQQLMKAYTLFNLDDEYVVMEGQVKIVDEQTGRIMEGRRYSDGLHQAIEAKENVKIENASQTYATITLQNFFRMYSKLSGMTGTAETEAMEFWQIYKLDCVTIPTNKKITRKDMEDLVYKTEREKFNAVIEEIVKLRNAGRPVLVGTTSVEKSELLSRMLKIREVPHNVLNAKHHQREAEIISEAGQTGQVTIATNMAGRGTDIKLSAEVKAAGGLAIIGTERHDSRRVDRQLRGRAGRQGDPGSSQFFVCLEDKLMRLFGSERIAKVMDKMGHQEGDSIQHSMVTNSIERAQKKVEENNFGVRKRLLEYDDVMNVQRDAIYRMRNNALQGDRLAVDLMDMYYKLAEDAVYQHKGSSFSNFEIECLKNFGVEPPFDEATFNSASAESLSDKLYDHALEHYQKKMDSLNIQVKPIIERVYAEQGSRFKSVALPFFDGKKGMEIALHMEEYLHSNGKTLPRTLEKTITLSVIDHSWKDHLRIMDELKEAVQTSVAGEQKDPLVIYKKEAYEQFRVLVSEVNQEVVHFLFKGGIPIQENQPAQPPRQLNRDQQQALHTNREEEDAQAEAAAKAGREENANKVVTHKREEPKIGRNDLCPCGSGKKFKQCHGKV